MKMMQLRTMASSYVNFMNQDNDLLQMYNTFPRVYKEGITFKDELHQEQE